MQQFLIVRAGGTFPEYAAQRGDFEDWTAAGMGLGPDEWTCVDAQAGDTLPDPTRFAGAVITGSHDMVTDDAPWMIQARQWIVRAVDAGLPLLGICFGHQLMAHALGGEAGYHPDGMEIGTAAIRQTEEGRRDPLLKGLPEMFAGHVTHSQTALRLPPEAILLATGDHDAHQCFRVGERAWGVQFHPEFDAPAIRHYVEQLRSKLEEAGRDVDAILDTVRDTPESASLLRDFAGYCRNR